MTRKLFYTKLYHKIILCVTACIHCTIRNGEVSIVSKHYDTLHTSTHSLTPFLFLVSRISFAELVNFSTFAMNQADLSENLPGQMLGITEPRVLKDICPSSNIRPSTIIMTDNTASCTSHDLQTTITNFSSNITVSSHHYFIKYDTQTVMIFCESQHDRMASELRRSASPKKTFNGSVPRKQLNVQRVSCGQKDKIQTTHLFN